jgi:hypothetical protein
MLAPAETAAVIGAFRKYPRGGVLARDETVRTMLRLSRRQRELAGDKLADLANLAPGALVFGQALTGSFTGPMAFVIAAVGVLVWALLTWGALRVSREGRR